jgi:hypothetical protein
VHEQSVQRIADLLSTPKPLKPQTERRLAGHMADRHTDINTFLLCAAEVLEEDELDVLFAPQFTPSLDDQAMVSQLLHHWQPDADDVRRLIDDLINVTSHAIIVMPDSTEAKLTIHEVMIDRFVRLLRLEQAPSSEVAASLRQALPTDLWPIGAALLRQRGFVPPKQECFARFVNHMATRHDIDRGLLETAAQFIADQPDMAPGLLMEEAEAQVKAAHGTVAYAQSGRAYWSPDVAQHHHYRGQGQVNERLVEQRQAEAQWLELIEADLKTFDG